MSDLRRCPRCGATLDSLDPDGRCAACLLELAMGSGLAPDLGTDDAVPGPAATQIGPYRILETLGEGGMGIVYLAEQQQPLRRKVALKLVRAGMNARAVVARFESERQVMALMDHPNIACVFDAGATEDGRPYFAMEYVPGLPITDYCDQHLLSTKARLALFAEVCAAIQHAHQKGIIHLDLKPTNVLVAEQDGRPVPKVIDFGVSKAIEQRQAEVTLFTEHGLLVGTPEYMSPEQASGGDLALDTRTDIYALGVLLYELLVGALPFSTQELRRGGYDELRRMIREVDPPKPSTRIGVLADAGAEVAAHRKTDLALLRRELRGDLDWIVMKALEKEPSRRYASASEFGADIRRHLEDEPVAASPPSVAYRLRKFARRHKGPVAAAAAVVAALIAGVAVSTAMFLNAEDARRMAEQQRSEADRQRRAAESATTEAVLQRNSADAERAKAEAARGETLQMYTSATAAREEAEHQRREAQDRAYAATIAAADGDLDMRNSSQAMSRLQAVEPSLRGWEWRILFRKADSSLSTLYARGSFSWFPARSSSIQFDESGATPRIFWNTERTVHVWDRSSYKPLATHSGWGSVLALGPAGTLVLTQATSEAAIQAVHVRNLASSNVVATLAKVDGRVNHAVFSADGARVAATVDGQIRVWETQSGRLLTTLDEPGVFEIMLGPDGSKLASSGKKGLRIWSVPSGELTRVLTTSSSGNTALTFSPDGTRIAVGSDVNVLVFALNEETAGGPMMQGHHRRVTAIAFNRDGTKLASGGLDGLVRVWNARTYVPIATWTGHSPLGVVSVAFDPLDSRLFSADQYGGGGSLRVWDLSTPSGLKILESAELSEAVAFSPDGSEILAGTRSGDIQAWNLQSLKNKPPLRGHRGEITDLAVSVVGSMLASASTDSTVKIWDLRSHLLGHTLTGHVESVNAVAIDRLGQHIISGSNDRSVRVWDASSGKELARLDVDERVNAVQFVPSSRSLIIGAGDRATITRPRRTLYIWDWRANRLQAAVDPLAGRAVATLAASPDGRLVAAAPYVGANAAIWDVAQRRVIGQLENKRGADKIAFTPDGARIVTASGDGTARIWNPRTFQQLLTLMQPWLKPVRGLAISPDGSRVAMAATPHILIWDSRSPYHPEAENLIEGLIQKHVFSAVVIEKLESDRSLPPDLRQAALRYVRARGDDPTWLNSDAWEVVKRPGARASAYRMALRRAEFAHRLEPLNPSFRNTVALATYRLGQYARALETVEASDRRNRYDVVVSVLARSELGQLNGLDADLDRLAGSENRDPDLDALVAEARALLRKKAARLK